MSQAQTADQPTARPLTATAADVEAFDKLVQRVGHFWLSFLHERLGLFRSPHSLDVGGGEMVHENCWGSYFYTKRCIAHLSLVSSRRTQTVTDVVVRRCDPATLRRTHVLRLIPEGGATKNALEAI